jgi:hypothetical protein
MIKGHEINWLDGKGGVCPILMRPKIRLLPKNNAEWTSPGLPFALPRATGSFERCPLTDAASIK